MNNETLSDRLITHLSKLRGDIDTDDIVVIDGHVVKALSAFNVYTMVDTFRAEITNIGKQYTDLKEDDINLIGWLNITKAAKTLPPDYAFKGIISYDVALICPTFKDIIKTMIILNDLLGDSGMYELSVKDVYYYSLYREILSKIEYDQNKTRFQNVENIISLSTLTVNKVRAAWRATQIAGMDLSIIKTMDEILCFDNVKASELSAFKGISTGA
jgi:hypothetical protein